MLYTDLVREGDHEEIPVGRSAAGVHRVPVEAEIGSVSRLAHAGAGHGLVGVDSVIPVQVVVIGRVSPGPAPKYPSCTMPLYLPPLIGSKWTSFEELSTRARTGLEK